mgnify:CR=1 FL=1
MKKFFFIVVSVVYVWSATPNRDVSAYMLSLKKEANVEGFSIQRGEEIFFATQMKNNQRISCTSCHTTNVRMSGENIKSGKKISPLAPSVNSHALTDVAEIKKWLRRNFNDVYGREGTALEKGHVLTFLLAQ